MLYSVQREGTVCLVSSGEVSDVCCLIVAALRISCAVVFLLLRIVRLSRWLMIVVDVSLLVVGYSHRTHYEFHCVITREWKGELLISIRISILLFLVFPKLPGGPHS